MARSNGASVSAAAAAASRTRNADTGGSSVTTTRPSRRRTASASTRSRCATRLLGPSRWSRTRLHTSWLTQATSRASVESRRTIASAAASGPSTSPSPASTSAATADCSCSASRSLRPLVTRCSATRRSSSSARAGGKARRVGFGQEAARLEAEQARRAERVARPRERLDVTQPAAAVLEVGLEHLGHEAGTDAPQLRRLGQLREQPPGAPLRELAPTRHELVGEPSSPAM